MRHMKHAGKYKQTIVTSVLSLSMFVFIMFPSLIFAQAGLTNPLEASGVNNFSQLLRIVLSAVIAITFPIIVLFLVYTGFLFLTAQGDVKKISDARTYLLYTIIGGLIVLGSYALSLAIQSTVCSVAPTTSGC